MNFGHHPDPAIDFCVEVEAIEGEIIDQAAGLSPQFDLNERITQAMQFKVGGDTQAVVAKVALRALDAAFRAGRAALAAPPGSLAAVQPPLAAQSEQPQGNLAVSSSGNVHGDTGREAPTVEGLMDCIKDHENAYGGGGDTLITWHAIRAYAERLAGYRSEKPRPSC